MGRLTRRTVEGGARPVNREGGATRSSWPCPKGGPGPRRARTARSTRGGRGPRSADPYRVERAGAEMRPAGATPRPAPLAPSVQAARRTLAAMAPGALSECPQRRHDGSGERGPPGTGVRTTRSPMGGGLGPAPTAPGRRWTRRDGFRSARPRPKAPRDERDPARSLRRPHRATRDRARSGPGGRDRRARAPRPRARRARPRAPEARPQRALRAGEGGAARGDPRRLSLGGRGARQVDADGPLRGRPRRARAPRPLPRLHAGGPSRHGRRPQARGGRRHRAGGRGRGAGPEPARARRDAGERHRRRDDPGPALPSACWARASRW